MILVDTGPLVALFDPKDGQHQGAANTLRKLRERLTTTVPVLTKVFHRRVFTLDKTNFATYRIRHGHRHQAVDLIG